MGGWRTKEPEARFWSHDHLEVPSDRGNQESSESRFSHSHRSAAEALSDFGLLYLRSILRMAKLLSPAPSPHSPLAEWSGAALGLGSEERAPHGRTKDGAREGRQTAASGSQSPRFPGGTSRGEQTILPDSQLRADINTEPARKAQLQEALSPSYIL